MAEQDPVFEELIVVAGVRHEPRERVHDVVFALLPGIPEAMRLRSTPPDRGRIAP